MFTLKLDKLLYLTAVSVTAVLVSSLAGAGEGGFVPVFNGKDLTGFKYVLQVGTKKETVGDKTKNIPIREKGDDPLKASTNTWRVENGVIICTGKPNGYIYTNKSFKNYIAKYDWRYKRPADLQDEEKFTGNSGFLAHIQEGDTASIWPKCVEIQGMNRDHGKPLAVSGAPKPKVQTFDAEALKKARKPVGEWNTTEMVFDNGKVTTKVNGVLVSTYESDLTEGPFGLQSEGAEIHFKNILVKAAK